MGPPFRPLTRLPASRPHLRSWSWITVAPPESSTETSTSRRPLPGSMNTLPQRQPGPFAALDWLCFNEAQRRARANDARQFETRPLEQRLEFPLVALPATVVQHQHVQIHD